jgi:hypothetical protein
MNLRFLHRRPTPADLAPVPVPPAAAPKPTPAIVPNRAAFTPPPEFVPMPSASPFEPGRYVVTYHRFGRHGDRRYGQPAPATLTLVADSAVDMAEKIRRDIAPFVVGVGTRIEVTVDLDVSGGKITAGGITGTFTFTRGGAR